MEIKVKTQLGGVMYELNFDEKGEMETLHKAAVLGNPPKYCQCCQNAEHFSLDSNKDKEGNIYVNVVCRKCWAKAKLGLYKSGGYFWHKFEKYEKKENGTTPKPKNEEVW